MSEICQSLSMLRCLKICNISTHKKIYSDLKERMGVCRRPSPIVIRKIFPEILGYLLKKRNKKRISDKKETIFRGTLRTVIVGGGVIS